MRIIESLVCWGYVPSSGGMKTGCGVPCPLPRWPEGSLLAILFKMASQMVDLYI